MELLRGDYKNPGIFHVGAQFLVNWTPDDALGMADELRGDLEKALGPAFEPVMKQVDVNFDEQTSIVSSTRFGVCFGEQEDHVEIGRNGIVLSAQGRYRGREHVFQRMTAAYELLLTKRPDLVVERVSTVVHSNICPPGDGRFRIEDYIVPRFEWQDPLLENYWTFRHDVIFNLETHFPGTLAKAIILRPDMQTGRSGIDVIIDVLDHNARDGKSVIDRLVFVKDLETHIFERTITGNTRKLYA